MVYCLIDKPSFCPTATELYWQINIVVVVVVVPAKFYILIQPCNQYTKNPVPAEVN